MPRAFEKFFYGTTRRPEQTLLSYVADHREALGEVEKHGVQISDKVSGWILLRRSGLTHEQKQLILSQNPKLSYSKVVEAMYFLLGQDYKGKPVDTASRWKSKTYGRWNNKSYGYTAEEVYDLDEPYPDDYAYQQYEDVDDEDEWPEDAEEPYDEDTYNAQDYEDTEFP